MVMGKHNYIITFAAGLIADRLGNALIAPTIAFVPEGNYESPTFRAGVISTPQSFPALMEAAARSLEVHGFTDILIVGDNGGNQNGIRAVTEKLNAEWAGSGTTVYGLTDYYQRGQEYSRVWLQAFYGYDMGTIGTHAGITDTSAMMYVFPDGIRRDQIRSEAEGQSGDPTKARADIGRMVVNFKVLAALAQYEAFKSPPRAGGRRGRAPEEAEALAFLGSGKARARPCGSPVPARKTRPWTAVAVWRRRVAACYTQSYVRPCVELDRGQARRWKEATL